MKGLFLKKLLAVVRGIFKSLPIGNTINEISQNLKQSEVVLNTEGEPTIKSPHDWLSIGTQLLVIGLIIYSFFNKTITLENLMKLLGVEF